MQHYNVLIAWIQYNILDGMRSGIFHKALVRRARKTKVFEMVFENLFKKKNHINVNIAWIALKCLKIPDRNGAFIVYL